MEIIIKSVDEIHEYENNPRNNDDAVQYVAESIKEFGFKAPILIDQDGIIIAGHTRVKAARQLDMKKLPCIVADDLTDDQIKAYRLIDNKCGEISGWDFDKLEQELEGLDFEWKDFGFPDIADDDLYDDAPDLEETYKEPEMDKLQCPKCGHIDSKARFRKV